MIKQVQKTLPRQSWQGVTIIENNEPLVALTPTNKLLLGTIRKKYNALFVVRKTIAEKLMRVSESLPDGLKLVLIEGYRTFEHQVTCWDDKFRTVSVENPTWNKDRVEQEVGLVVARPSPLANHHCGGAVDVTLAYDNDHCLDMGSPYPTGSLSANLHDKFAMFSNSINPIQTDNRRILREAMEREEFVWYPAEWWHYCYGDRMWAVYTNRTECFYGSIDL